MEETSCDLLAEWHRGDVLALNKLVELHRSWIHRFAGDKLGGRLRQLRDSEDVVQSALVRLLRYGPRFAPANEAQFRALIARIVLNTVRNIAEHEGAARRDPGREGRFEHPIGSSGVSRIGPAAPSSARPDRKAEKDEERAYVRLAIELLDVADREIVVLHQWDGRTFADIANEFGIETKTANKRYQRAVTRLGRMVRRLREGSVDDFIEDVRPYLESVGEEIADV